MRGADSEGLEDVKYLRGGTSIEEGVTFLQQKWAGMRRRLWIVKIPNTCWRERGHQQMAGEADMSGRERGGRNGEEGEGDVEDVEDGGGPARKVATVIVPGNSQNF